VQLVLATLKEEIAAISKVELDAFAHASLEYVSSLCGRMINQRKFDLKEWTETVRHFALPLFLSSHLRCCCCVLLV
jgi:hypothetical protein